MLLGPILGPVLGGAILQHLTWRWLFLVNVPVGALALALAVFSIPEDDALIQRRTFDLPGFLILAPALVLFLCGAGNIRDHSGQLCFAFAIMMIIVFAPRRDAQRTGGIARPAAV
jgi:MFS family permease